MKWTIVMKPRTIFHQLLHNYCLCFSFTQKATSWLGLAMVSVVRCAGVWTNNKCCLLDWTKTIISLTWLLPMTNITYFLTLRWSSEEHVRTGYICWFFCGVKEMLHVSPISHQIPIWTGNPESANSVFFLLVTQDSPLMLFLAPKTRKSRHSCLGFLIACLNL